MAPVSAGSSVLFAAVNLLLYLRHRKLVRRFRRLNGRYPDIARPRTYAERMFWRKAVDHNPLFVTFSDKLAAKEYSARLCPDLPLPKTLWVGRDADAIPEDCLRGDVVVKATHGCNFNYFVRGGAVDRRALKAQCDQWLRTPYGRRTGEWAYSRVEPRLFVEQIIGDARKDLLEFQVRAGGGRAVVGSIIGRGKQPDQWAVYLDLEGNPIPGLNDADDAPAPALPSGLDIREPYRRAVRFAERLSVGVDYARFDFFWNGEELLGGEITVYPASGVTDVTNTRMRDTVLAGWDLSQSHFLRARHTGATALYANALRRALGA